MPEATPVTPEAPKRFEIPSFADLEAVPEAPATPEVKDVAESPKTQDTGEQATPATPEAKPETKEELTPEQAEERKRKSEGARYGRRLDKAYRERAEAKARADLLEKRLAELEKPKALTGEPKLEQFDFDPEKYATAKAEFAKAQTEKELTAKREEESAKERNERLMSDWEEKSEKASEKYPDFHEKVHDLKPDNDVLASMMEAENAADIAYFLADNPKELKRISLLPVRSQIREIGKLEMKLASEPEKPKAPSKAPAPVTPLTGTAPITNAAPSEEDDMGTWIRKRQKQVYGKR